MRVVCEFIAEVLDTIEELAGTSNAYGLDDVGDDIAEGLLGDNVVEEAYFHGDDLVDDDTSHGSFHHTLSDGAVLELILYDDLDGSVNIYTLLVVGDECFLRAIEGQAFAEGTRAQLRDVIQSEHHIL